jgi:hypothetical protein
MADAWWSFKLRFAGSEDVADDDPEWWAIELFHPGAPLWEQQDLLRRAVSALADRMPSDADPGVLGAGPVEGIITTRDEDLRWIEEEAARSPRFRAALANVWIEEFGSETFLRVQRAAGVDLVWHEGRGPRPLPGGSYIDPEFGRSMT